MTEDRYTHGHHRSVVDAHATRTVANSAAYLVPHLEAGMSLLDVGCGPGTITAELAQLLNPGAVLGIDSNAEVVARAAADLVAPNLTFTTMDAYALDCADDSFDVAHAHQVLQHVSDPVALLTEMRRVVRPGGIVAVRDADYAAMHWAPASPLLDRWQSLYRQVAHANDAEPDAGRHLVRWARLAGFADVSPSVDTWLFRTSEQRGWWGSTWAERIVSSALAEQAIELGLASADDLAELADGWRSWSNEVDGWFVVVHGQLICRV